MPYDLREAPEKTESNQLTPVDGKPFSIGAGFEALSFKHAMFSGSMDPLIMVDHFTMTEPTFGAHAHAGLSAVSILFEDSEGAFSNKDSLGNDIDLMPGDLYWLKAGRGAVHDEKPRPGARTHGLQIFVNLPARLKYDAPSSLHVNSSDMPQIIGRGHRARLLLGQSGGQTGGVSPALPMTILDVDVEADGVFEHKIPSGQSAWVLSVKGSSRVTRGGASATLDHGSAVALTADAQDQDLVISGISKAHFVILQAEPLREPFFQRGPFAMSTEQEVDAMIAAHAAGRLGSIETIPLPR